MSTDRSLPLVRVVRIDRHPVRAADVELVVVMGMLDGTSTLRRVSLPGSALPRFVPHLLDPDDDIPGRRGGPVVVDRTYESAEQALAAADGQLPGAAPYRWLGADQFRSLVLDEPDFSEAIAPWAHQRGDLAVLVAVLAAMGAVGGVLLAADVVNDWLRLDSPGLDETLADHVFGVVVLCLAGAVAVLTYRVLLGVLDRGTSTSDRPAGQHRTGRKGAPRSRRHPRAGRVDQAG